MKDMMYTPGTQLVIGLGHKKGVGKDTFGGFLKNSIQELKPELTIHLVSFAGNLKEIAYDIFKMYGMKRGEYYETNREAKETPLVGLIATPRDVYLKLGHVIRTLAPDYWIDSALNDVYAADVVIITDVRFPNEVDRIRHKYQGVLVRVFNPKAPVTDDYADCALDGPSDWWDYNITNIASLEHLKGYANALAKDLFNTVG